MLVGVSDFLEWDEIIASWLVLAAVGYPMARVCT
jgi:hypothetical protein